MTRFLTRAKKGGSSLRPGIALSLLLATAGCSSFQGAPNRAIDPGDDLAAIQSAISSTAVADCLAGTAAAPEECRNRIVTARKYAIDLRFSEFEQDYFAANRWTGLGSTLAALGLSAAGALSGTGTAQALAAAAAGVTGGRAAYEREILGERTLLTIDTAMHAQRDLVALAIRDGLTRSVRDYPLGTALSDLDAYYRAGTVVGALTTVTEAIGAKADSAQAELRNVLPFNRSAASQFLQARLRNGDAPLIRTAMQAAGVSDGVSVPIFVRTGSPAQMDAVARALGWTGAAADSAPPPVPRSPVPRPVATPPAPRPVAPRPVDASPAPTQPTPRPATGRTAREFLREFNRTPDNTQLIDRQIQSLGLPTPTTPAQFINTATRQQLETVARPLGWTP